MEPMYLEDLPAGLEVMTARRTVPESDIVTFAGVSGDFNPLHTDESYVREHTPFRGRIAHGLLVLAIASGVRSEPDRAPSGAFLEARRQFLAPTYPGHTVPARWT